MKFAFDNSTSQDKVDVKVFPNPFNKETFIYAVDEAPFVKVVVINLRDEIVYENSDVPSNERFMLDGITASGGIFCKSYLHKWDCNQEAC